MIRTSASAQEEGSARSAPGTPRNVTSGPYIPPSRGLLAPAAPPRALLAPAPPPHPMCPSLDQRLQPFVPQRSLEGRSRGLVPAGSPPGDEDEPDRPRRAEPRRDRHDLCRDSRPGNGGRLGCDGRAGPPWV